MKHKLLHFVMIGKTKMTEYEKSFLHDAVYQKDTNDKIRVWRAEIGYNDENEAGYRVHSGIFGGKTVVSTWKKAESKNVGKSNETTAFVQAQKEANAARIDKISRGYCADIAMIDVNDKPFKPMLAHTYEPDKVDFKVGAVLGQPKLDGIRCIAKKEGLFTRTGKKITSCNHIWRDIREIFDKDPNIVLDGELYNHDLKDNFNEITSIVRKQKPTQEDLKKCLKIKYYIYDVVQENAVTYLERVDLIGSLTTLFSRDYIQVVTTMPLSSAEEAESALAEMIEEGYEGLMIRINEIPYENKRSKSLLKYKEFLTDEFKVVNIEEGEGNWSGHIKTFVCIKEDGTEFGAGVRGNQETLKELFESNKKPDWATVRYFTPTPDGVPRFPVVVDWGYGERDD